MSQQLPLKQKYQVLPAMPPEQFEALKADIAERGVLTPIDVDEYGQILDGHHRYRACVELGMTDFPTIVRPGMSEEDRRMFARKANMLRRHLSREQVRYLIAEQLRDTPNWADNRIAQALGVNDKTVRNLRNRLEATSEIPKFDRLVGADGKERPVKRQPAIMAADVGELRRILDRLADGADGGELVGFLTEHSFSTFTTPNYNSFAHCDDAGKRDWHLFIHFLVRSSGRAAQGAACHVEWILQHQFKSPAEWLGEVGSAWRKRVGLREPSRKFKKAWAVFLDECRDKELAEVCAELETIEKVSKRMSAA